MNKKVVKPIILAIVFIGALITFSIITNKENEELTTAMAEATLPVVNFVYMDTEINELHGYVKEMDLGTMREAVTPVDSDNKLHMVIGAYGQEIDHISYEIRSVEDNRLLVDNDEAEHIIDGEKVVCDISLPSLFEENEEYNMMIRLAIGKQDVYYYTRLMKESAQLNESLAFALQFHEYTFRDDADTFIPTYMDPATGDATKLSYVDLSCTLKQITWADFEGIRLTEPMAYIEEVNDSYNVIVLKYVMTNVNESSEVEYYNVEEYYRLRKAEKRMYVLNFERRMNQIFRVENSFIRDDSAIVLGIRDENVEYMSNESGDSIAFVQEGELWSYHRMNNTISQVFSFRGPEGISTKENWNQHDIRIIKVDEAGSVDFVVYGYMNRGTHEGEVGIGVYHYDGIAHTVEEELFISSTKSYDALKTELGELLYVNEQKIMYLMLNRSVYKINLTTYEVTVEQEELKKTQYAVSESKRFFAWVDDDNSPVLHLADLKTGITYEVKDEEGTYLRPLAFFGEDFVYGIAKAENVKKDIVGNTVFPMSSLKIMNTYEEQKEIIKDYVPLNGFIKEIDIEENNIYVTLMKEDDGVYAVSGSDIIMNREMEATGSVDISTMVTEKKQTQILLTMKKLTTNEAIKAIASKHILLEEETEKITLDTFTEQIYYVYARGEAVFASRDVSEAILVANEHLGIVVDQERNYIWKRARLTNRNAFKNLGYNEADAAGDSIVKALSTILMYEGKGLSVTEFVIAGQKPKDILQSTLPESTVLELYGCASDELLYYISKGTPVMAYVENGQAILLTGYSSGQVYFYDPASGITGSMDFEDADTRLALGGQHVIVYLK